MQTVILAAGKGTRLRPLTYEIPKPMLPLKGKPVLEYTLDFLPEKINEVIIVVSYLGEHIKKHFGQHWKGRRIRYVVQKELNGTGGAIHSCRDIIEGKFLVIMGDDLYYKKDLNLLCQNGLAILAYEVDDPSNLGAFKIDKDGNLINIIESPTSKEYKLVNTGAYVMGDDFFNYKLVSKKPGDKEFGLPQTLVSMAQDHPVKILRATRWQPVNCAEELQKAEQILDEFLS